jgi:integrase/recombinase XerC/integrase/recombinase XerD
LSPATLRFYQFHLGVFTKKVGKVDGVTPADITAFIEGLTCAPGGKAAYFRAIRALYRWLEEQEYIERDPTRRLKCPRVPKPLRYAVPAKHLSHLIDACPALRDKLIVSLLADTGLRLSELSSLLAKNVDIPTSTMRLWGKGAKQRVGRYGPVTEKLMVAFVEEVKPEGALLGLSPNGIALVLKRLEHRTGIKCNAHSFRRTFACESVRNGLNLFYIQSLLGHSTLTMTRIYAEQVGSEDAIKAYQPVVR